MSYMILETAFQNKQIDSKTYEFCKVNKISSFLDLKDFLLREKPACGNRNADKAGPVYELFDLVLNICKLPLKYKVVNMHGILEAENASVRAGNVCNNSKIRNLFDFIQYLKIKKSYIKLKNCGTNTNKELTSIALKYLMVENTQQDNNKSEFAIEQQQMFIDLEFVELALLDRDVLLSLNSYLLKRLHSLSHRTKNVLNKYLDFPLTFYCYHEKIIKDIKAFKDQKNIGKASVAEIELVNEEIKYLYMNLCNTEISKVQADFLQFQFLCKKFYGIDSVDQTVLHDFENKNFKFFRFFDYIIARVLPDQNLRILKNYTKFSFYKNGENQTMDEIGRIYGITRQRVDQIIEGIEYAVRINLINYSYFFKYSCTKKITSQDIIVFDDQLADTINNSENVNYTNFFYSYALDIIYSSKYNLYKQDDIAVRSNSFMISNDILKLFKVERFLAEIENRLNEKIRVSYNLNLDEMIKNYVTILSEENYLVVREVCEKIIVNCYKGIEFLENTIVFLNNSKPKKEDIIVGIIERIGHPLTAGEIFEEYKILDPEYLMSSLRGILTNSSQIKYIRGGYGDGKETVYATEKMTIKNGVAEGTARDVAYEYLDSQKQPCHIDDIYDYVKTKRPNIDKGNLNTNLRLDSSNIIVLPLNFICLKKYSSDYSFNKQYPRQLQIYGKAYVNKTNCSYKDLISYLCGKYKLEIKFVKLVFDRLINNRTILSTDGTNETGVLRLSEQEIERMQNMKRKFI